MSAALTIRKVETRADFRAFWQFPWKLYKTDPHWVPPLVSMHKHKFDRQKNPSWQHMEGDYFIARRGDQPVGTIAAFINHRHNEFQGEHIGFFGYFEVVEDEAAAYALLDTAAEYVKGKGYRALRGPATFSTNEECGLLIEGFDQPPVVLYPYNPRYYQRFIESAPGFAGVMDTVSYYFTLQAAEQSEKVQKMLRITQKNSQRRGITVRLPDTRKLRQELTILKDIYNQAWEKNWGFVPFSEPELDALVKDLGQFLDPQITIFAEVDGEPVGFLLGLPDLNEALHLARPRPGKPEIMTLLQVLWTWKIARKINRIRIPLMGVKEAYRGIGVEAAMFSDLLTRCLQLAPQRGWTHADGGWVLETNEAMSRLAEVHGGYVYKRFRFYERPLV